VKKSDGSRKMIEPTHPRSLVPVALVASSEITIDSNVPSGREKNPTKYYIQYLDKICTACHQNHLCEKQRISRPGFPHGRRAGALDKLSVLLEKKTRKNAFDSNACPQAAESSRKGPSSFPGNLQTHGREERRKKYRRPRTINADFQKKTW
jgi:hypothetical protein